MMWNMSSFVYLQYVYLLCWGIWYDICSYFFTELFVVELDYFIAEFFEFFDESFCIRYAL